MQVKSTVYDVALDGRVISSSTFRDDAEKVQASNPRSQIRTRSESATVPAAFAVFVDKAQVGESTLDPGAAAKMAKKLGGMIKMVPAIAAA